MARSAFNPYTRKGKVAKQHERTWTTDPETGLSDCRCKCGVQVLRYPGDPQEWADKHVCTGQPFSMTGGVPG